MHRWLVYIVIGVMCLAGLIDRRVPVASAQAAGQITAAHFELNGLLTFVIGHRFYVSSGPIGSPVSPNPNLIPGTSPVIATGLNSDGISGNTGATQFVVLLDSGDLYTTPYDDGAGLGTWTAQGNVYSGSTAGIRGTWGQLKARYR